MAWIAERIDWASCHQWQIDNSSIHHKSLRYFSVVFARDTMREHVLIDQPEIGILGFVVAGQGPDRQWLMQHKAEPGNVNYIQWAPTVQATQSNYERAHGGKPTRFLELFSNPSELNNNILGSEQGDRFLNKFNSNRKRLIKEVFEIQENDGQFSWCSNVELKSKLRQDYMVNTDCRSVIASGSWNLLADVPQRIFLDGDLDSDIATALHHSYCNGPSHDLPYVMRLLANVHSTYPIHYERVSPHKLTEHELSVHGVHHKSGARVLGYFDCHMPDREISRWQQPLIERELSGHYVLLFSIINGSALFFVAAYPEIGFHGRVEFGPSLQTGNSAFKQDTDVLIELLDSAEIIIEIYQSDEGGRFYRNIGHYVLACWHGSQSSLDAIDGYWLTLADLEVLSGEKGVLSNELRTLLSLILSFA